MLKSSLFPLLRAVCVCPRRSPLLSNPATKTPKPMGQARECSHANGKTFTLSNKDAPQSLPSQTVRVPPTVRRRSSPTTPGPATGRLSRVTTA